MSFSRRSFTLIELLVVVAVLSVLAAIAFPNYLEAQTRAKVSRALADIRTMSVAVEAYAVDRNQLPRMTWGRAPYFDNYTGHGVYREQFSGTLGPWITTPVAYLVRFDFLDPFVGRLGAKSMDERLYTYLDLPTQQFLFSNGFHDDPATRRPQVFTREFGAWAMMSVGPDLWSGSDGGVGFWCQYDSTNGTISNGNIWRSQKFADQHFYDFSDVYTTE